MAINKDNRTLVHKRLNGKEFIKFNHTAAQEQHIRVLLVENAHLKEVITQTDLHTKLIAKVDDMVLMLSNKVDRLRSKLVIAYDKLAERELWFEEQLQLHRNPSRQGIIDQLNTNIAKNKELKQKVEALEKNAKSNKETINRLLTKINS